MCNRHNELDVSRTLTAYLLLRNLHTTTVADDAAISNSLILSAGTLEVLCRTEDALTEETVTLWLVGTVVNGLWLCHLAKGVCKNLLWRSNTNGYLGKIILYLCFFLGSHIVSSKFW